MHIAGLKLNDLCWKQLKYGIQNTRVLRTFIINMTTVTRTQLMLLAEGMKQNLSVDTIDLSYN